MTRKPFYRRTLSALRKSMVAAAIGLAVASGAAADPVETLQITSGFMTAWTADPEGQWTLAAPDLSATGQFQAFGGQGPYGQIRFRFPEPFGTSVPMGWVADAADGLIASTMVFNGVAYNINEVGLNSPITFMTLDASAIVIDHVGSYMEPFTFEAKLCGFLTAPTNDTDCDATVNLVGSGTLDLVVVPDPHPPGGVDYQSVSYRFAGVPEPATIALLVTGLVGLGVTRCRALAVSRDAARQSQSAAALFASADSQISDCCLHREALPVDGVTIGLLEAAYDLASSATHCGQTVSVLAGSVRRWPVAR